MLLFGAVVHAFTSESYAEQVAVEFQAVLRARYDDRGVVDAQEKFIVLLLPARIAFTGRKIDDLEIVAVSVFEIEGADFGGGFVARGDCLGSGGSMADFVSAQLLVGLVHVADDDGDVLKRKIVTAPIGGNGSALRSEILRQLDYLIAELHARDAHAQTEDALQLLVFRAVHFDVADLLKAQHFGKKFHRTIDIRNRHADGIDGFHDLRCRGVGYRHEHGYENEHASESVACCLSPHAGFLISFSRSGFHPRAAHWP